MLPVRKSRISSIPKQRLQLSPSTCSSVYFMTEVTQHISMKFYLAVCESEVVQTCLSFLLLQLSAFLNPLKLKINIRDFLKSGLLHRN